LIVKPETVLRWHREGFKLFWTRLSRRKGAGRPPVNSQVKALIKQMAQANPLWGAPRILFGIPDVFATALGLRIA